MTVTVTQQRISHHTTRVSFASGESDPLYRVWIDGNLVSQTRANHYDVTVATNDTATVEVRDDAVAPSYAKPARSAITWEGVVEGADYEVATVDGAVSTLVGMIGHTAVGDQHTVVAPPLGQEETIVMGVTPIGEDANKGSETTITVGAVRHPAQPDVTISHASGMLTLAAAT